MFKQKRLTVLSLAVMFALLMAAVMPMSALADDGVPPQPETPVVEEPVVDVPVVEEPVVAEPAAEEPTVAEVLAEVPAGTDVVVLDENGEALPLASAEAADAILVSDPMWCPVGTTIVTAAVCENDLTVAGLLAKLLAAGKNADGVIYFMSYTRPMMHILMRLTQTLPTSKIMPLPCKAGGMALRQTVQPSLTPAFPCFPTLWRS
jgi:hypothetical protein